jgi:hypothetical protein
MQGGRGVGERLEPLQRMDRVMEALRAQTLPVAASNMSYSWRAATQTLCGPVVSHYPGRMATCAFSCRT